MDLKNSTLDDIAAVIGFTATLRLVAWYGEFGNVYVPQQVEEGQVLVNLLGMSAAKKLSEEWPGEFLTVRKLNQYEMDRLRRQVSILLENGLTTRQVSHIIGMSERRVQQICRELEVAGLMAPIVSGEKRQGKSDQKMLGKNAEKNWP